MEGFDGFVLEGLLWVLSHSHIKGRFNLAFSLCKNHQWDWHTSIPHWYLRSLNFMFQYLSGWVLVRELMLLVQRLIMLLTQFKLLT